MTFETGCGSVALEVAATPRIQCWADASASDDEDDLYMPILTSAVGTTDESQRPVAMNAQAAEFIPTLTYPCPLLGVCILAPMEDIPVMEAPAPGDWLRDNDAVSTTCSSFDLDESAQRSWKESCIIDTWAPTPAEAASMRRTKKEIKKDTRQHSASFDTSATSPASSQDFSRTNSICRTDSGDAASERKQASRPKRKCGKAAVRASEDVSLANNKATYDDAEEESEEVWVERMEKRRLEVEAYNQSVEYVKFSSLNTLGEDTRVRCPDPMDRSISKRQWKYDLHQWKKFIRTEAERLSGEGLVGSVISTEEGPSSIGDDDEDRVSTC